jgi:hypothetical protein
MVSIVNGIECTITVISLIDPTTSDEEWSNLRDHRRSRVDIGRILLYPVPRRLAAFVYAHLVLKRQIRKSHHLR